jgi:hypothetical protein
MKSLRSKPWSTCGEAAVRVPDLPLRNQTDETITTFSITLSNCFKSWYFASVPYKNSLKAQLSPAMDWSLMTMGASPVYWQLPDETTITTGRRTTRKPSPASQPLRQDHSENTFLLSRGKDKVQPRVKKADANTPRSKEVKTTKHREKQSRGDIYRSTPLARFIKQCAPRKETKEERKARKDVERAERNRTYRLWAENGGGLDGISIYF